MFPWIASALHCTQKGISILGKQMLRVSKSAWVRESGKHCKVLLNMVPKDAWEYKSPLKQKFMLDTVSSIEPTIYRPLVGSIPELQANPNRFYCQSQCLRPLTLPSKIFTNFQFKPLSWKLLAIFSVSILNELDTDHLKSSDINH